MKKFFIAVVAVVALASCNQSKIGYVDTEKLVKEYQGYIDVDNQLKVKGEQFAAKYQQIENDLKAQLQAKKITEKEMQQKYQELSGAYQQEGAMLQKDSEERSKKIIDEVKDFVKEYAKKNSYSFILGSNESGNVLYGDEKSDLTEKMIEAINKDYKEGDKTEKAPKEEKKDTTKTGK